MLAITNKRAHFPLSLLPSVQLYYSTPARKCQPFFQKKRKKVFFKNPLTNPVKCDILISSKRGRHEAMKNTEKENMEIMEILAYMIENGYHLMNRTMEDYCRDFTVEDVRAFCACFMGEDPRA